MNRLSLSIDDEERLEATEHIGGWLETVTTEDAGSGFDQQKERGDPVTPRRPNFLHERYDEVSPTDTSFSSGSVFEVPEQYHHEHGSPRLRRFREDVFAAKRYSRDTQDDEPAVEEPNKKKAERRLVLPLFTSPRRDARSLTSHGPLSSDSYDTSLDEPLATPIELSALTPSDPNAPRIVNLVSCLQCTFANLPCSRTTPACTRCTRNRTADTCLLLRRRFAEEIDASDPGCCTLPVLLKTRGESAESWNAKMDVAMEMEEKWNEMQDSKNWVLPRVGGGGRGNEHVGTKIWPSEGLGRVAYEELVVVMDLDVDMGVR